MVAYLLDSCILIDFLNLQPAARQFVSLQRGVCAISDITRAEVLVGDPAAREWLNTFQRIPIDTGTAENAAEIRRQIPRIKRPDAFQVAIAETHRLQLVTRDRDLQRPCVMIPYSLP